MAGTIADFVVTMLCNLPAVVMSDQNAASWGYYDMSGKCWQIDVLDRVGFPVGLLPNIVTAGTEVGKTTCCLSGLPAGTAVHVAAGDAQCSVLSTQFLPHQAVLNMGTSCQLSFLSATAAASQPAGLQKWPYKGNQHLLVLASMNGGNVLANFVVMLQGWMRDLGVDMAEESIWRRLSAMTNSQVPGRELGIKPTLYKEREMEGEHSGGTVNHVLPSNTSLSQIYQQTCLGIVCNIYDMLSPVALSQYGITEIMCTGSVFTKHPFMLTAVSRLFATTTKVNTCDNVDAAFGAILMTQ